jgi:hypothetical protein
MARCAENLVGNFVETAIFRQKAGIRCSWEIANAAAPRKVRWLFPN